LVGSGVAAGVSGGFSVVGAEVGVAVGPQDANSSARIRITLRGVDRVSMFRHLVATKVNAPPRSSPQNDIKLYLVTFSRVLSGPSRVLLYEKRHQVVLGYV